MGPFGAGMGPFGAGMGPFGAGMGPFGAQDREYTPARRRSCHSACRLEGIFRTRMSPSKTILWRRDAKNNT